MEFWEVICPHNWFYIYISHNLRAGKCLSYPVHSSTKYLDSVFIHLWLNVPVKRHLLHLEKVHSIMVASGPLQVPLHTQLKPVLGISAPFPPSFKIAAWQCPLVLNISEHSYHAHYVSPSYSYFGHLFGNTRSKHLIIQTVCSETNKHVRHSNY